eukprot:COSAG03_NODE_14082_length_478_cov_0.546174_1_plen_95_part_10
MILGSDHGLARGLGASAILPRPLTGPSPLVAGEEKWGALKEEIEKIQSACSSHYLWNNIRVQNLYANVCMEYSSAEFVCKCRCAFYGDLFRGEQA